MIFLYDYAIATVKKAQAQGKPEWALSEKEKRALRHLTSVNKNFVVVAPEEEQPLEQ